MFYDILMNVISISCPVDISKFTIFVEDVPVACGGHTASSCSECPQGNGATWCNGDCQWSKADGKCQLGIWCILSIIFCYVYNTMTPSSCQLWAKSRRCLLSRLSPGAWSLLVPGRLCLVQCWVHIKYVVYYDENIPLYPACCRRLELRHPVQVPRDPPPRHRRHPAQAVRGRAGNEGPRNFHNHGEGP